jgi:hypothetical protein
VNNNILGPNVPRSQDHINGKETDMDSLNDDADCALDRNQESSEILRSFGLGFISISHL